MLSHESRYFVVVAASAVAGAAVAWVPLTSAPLPFRETSSYLIWVLLFAITGAACPIVWTNGRKALSVTPPSGSLVKEIIWYVLFAAIAITVFSVAAIAFFSRASPISHASPIAVPSRKYGSVSYFWQTLLRPRRAALQCIELVRPAGMAPDA